MEIILIEGINITGSTKVAFRWPVNGTERSQDSLCPNTGDGTSRFIYSQEMTTKATEGNTLKPYWLWRHSSFKRLCRIMKQWRQLCFRFPHTMLSVQQYRRDGRSGFSRPWSLRTEIFDVSKDTVRIFRADSWELGYRNWKRLSFSSLRYQGWHKPDLDSRIYDCRDAIVWGSLNLMGKFPEPRKNGESRRVRPGEL